VQFLYNRYYSLKALFNELNAHRIQDGGRTPLPITLWRAFSTSPRSNWDTRLGIKLIRTWQEHVEHTCTCRLREHYVHIMCNTVCNLSLKIGLVRLLMHILIQLKVFFRYRNFHRISIIFPVSESSISLQKLHKIWKFPWKWKHRCRVRRVGMVGMHSARKMAKLAGGC
jgi:hypothetical protein